MKYFFLVLLFCASWALPAAAETLSWDDILQQAKEHNPLLKKADQSLKQAELAYRQSFSGFLPQLSANAGANQSSSDTGGFNRSFSYGLSGSLTLFSGFADLSALRSSDCDRSIAAARYQRAYADVLFSLRKSYLTLLWAQESVKLAEDILARRTENARMIEMQYDSGAEDKGALLRVQADKVQAAYNLDKARRDAHTAQLELIRTIGRDDTDTAAAAGTLDPGPLAAADYSKDLVTRLPEYRVAAYTAAKAALQLTAARSGLYPDLTVSANTGKNGAAWAPDNNLWSAGVSLSYAFFTGGKNIYAARIASVEKDMAEETYRQTARDLEVRLSQSHNTLADAFGNVLVQQTRAVAAETQSSITTTKYMNGLSSYQDWYVIENDYVSGRISLLNAQRDAALALAQWENDLGSGEFK